ncbi:hypothetical protein B9479_004864 [Cryptococcus floricola]|uniref:Ricin B lectin domain-containing protein n=1 Tax=Cryptococcus floricola TaxID=2591691 RepID=A0A5D3AUP5_9TREE|nr:hypothetical protein B9479_004864 [Cryptococcus floricola]
MIASTLLALLPIVGLTSAAVVPRESAKFGRLLQWDDLTLCVKANDAHIGAAISFGSCVTNGTEGYDLQMWNFTNSAPFDNKVLNLQAYPDLCIDAGFVPHNGGKYSLQPCGWNPAGQLLSYASAGLISTSNGICMRKWEDSKEIDQHECADQVDHELTFTPA